MKVYNTMTRQKEELVPIKPGEISMYVCGPTVYNYFHLGNARPFVVFDTLRRYLEYRGNKVRFVQNFTDVDDKIINKAREEGVTAKEISEKYIEEYFVDAKAINVKKATVHPKVSETMKEIIGFVKDLEDAGYAYEIDGDVYFSTRKFENYGKLSKQSVDELVSGARIMIEEKKQDPLDFALWKARKVPDEIAWESPWGMGRPGWHIECSAMSKKYLGEKIDIHAGGQDLAFPHHENEIAQSEAHNGDTYVNYWMHNGYITIDKEKMAKSKGNFFTVRELLQEYPGEVIRFFLLSGHYRSPINYSVELMEQAKNSLGRMEEARRNLLHLARNGEEEFTKKEENKFLVILDFKEQYIKAMDDDLNTADAITRIFEMITAINTAVIDGCSKKFAQKCLDLLLELANVLGLLEGDEKDQTGGSATEEEIQALVEQRQEARRFKDYARADEIRDILKERGVTLKDTPQGVQIVHNRKN